MHNGYNEFRSNMANPELNLVHEPVYLLPSLVLAVPEPKHAPLPDLRTLFARYDTRLKQLAALRRRLRQRPKEEDEVPDPPPHEPTPIPTTYPTCFGTLTFDGIYERTRRYAASILHHSYHVAPDDVNDGLQAGYLALWKRLQAQPTLLEGKSLAWMGKLITYAALHATRSDWQFKRKAVSREDEDRPTRGAIASTTRAHSGEVRRADVRLDLHAAVATSAQAILAQSTGKQQQYDLWALYGLTMLQENAAETSRLFGVRKQSMQAAYTRVREQLQSQLPNYAPSHVTKPMVQGRGQKALPRQDMVAIRKANGDIPTAIYAAVKARIEVTKADTMGQDLVALAGIQQGMPAQTQAKAHHLSTARMQRAYARVHLMIGAQRDPTIRTRRPEKRVQSVFTLTEATAAAVYQLALELLQQPKSYEKLVALHAHISNLAISTTAKHFNIPTSTLRFYAQRIGTRLGTPTKPARE
jgi:hypothetical protein